MVDKHEIFIVGGESKIVDFSAEEQTAIDNYRATLPERKLAKIKQIRLEKLKETDYLALDDVTMSDAIKDYRQGMRNIPQNNTTEAEYDLILARDSDGKLTHSIWDKP